MKLTEILKDSNYKLSQFSSTIIAKMESQIAVKKVKEKEMPFFTCLIRKKEIRLTPEEVIRQLYLMVLIKNYQYPVERMELEYAVTFGRETKRADIVIFDKQKTTTPYIIVELKKGQSENTVE